jgi:sugar O-acyltransferase (sialic acid O-acetyltransferase NeuD family)
MPFEQFKERYTTSDAKIVIATGEPEHKVKLFNQVKKIGYNLANVIHPTAYISPDAKMGEGIIVQMGSMISVDAIIGNNVTLEQYVVVAHDAVIEDHVQISAFVMVAGHCKIGEATYIGIAVPIRDNIIVGKNSIVSMGAVVQRDIPDNVIVMGNPARVMKNRDGDMVFK